MTRPKYPPYRETGAAIPLSHLFAVVSQTIAATPPLPSLKMAYRNLKTGLTRGLSREQLACEAYRAIVKRRTKYYRQSRYSGTLRVKKNSVWSPKNLHTKVSRDMGYIATIVSISRDVDQTSFSSKTRFLCTQLTLGFFYMELALRP